MRPISKPLALSATLAALLAFSAPAALGQEQPAMPPAVSEDQIDAFADAAIEVQRVQTELEAQMQAAQDMDEIARLQEEAQVEATEAVEQKGLSTDEYTAIAEAANQDPELYAAIVDRMQTRMD
jgi:hypothetical protein